MIAEPGTMLVRYGRTESGCRETTGSGSDGVCGRGKRSVAS